MKEVPSIALVKLAIIINHVLSMGYFPVLFKKALLCLIAKPGKNNTDPTSYRLISLLEIPGKIMEQIINERITTYLENNEKFNKNQYGFRRGKGTQ